MTQHQNDREDLEQTAEPSIWETREGMMSEEEVRKLSAEKGKAQEGDVRADQAGEPGEQEGADAAQRADMEGGVSGQLKAKLAKEPQPKPKKASEWTKYDWS